MVLGQKSQVRHVYIAVMGITGAGKSTFISSASGQKVKVGHGLESCTVDVEDIQFYWNENLVVHLVDTPGFDDTTRSDVQVLQDIAHWLSKSFENGVKLSGLIFIHRISDVRLQGSARRNLLMFKKLCGEKVYQSVVLATSMWGKVDPEDGERRERELIQKDEYWGRMSKQGSMVFRLDNTRDSCLKVIEHILSLHTELTLDIQDEIVRKGIKIDETSAAKELNAEIIRERKKHQAELRAMKESMEEAIKDRDKELQKEFQEEIDNLQNKILKGQEEQQKLNQTLEEVHKRKEQEFKEFQEMMKQQIADEKKRYEQDRKKYEDDIKRRELEMQAQQQAALKQLQAERASREEMQKAQEEFRRAQEQKRAEDERKWQDIQTKNKERQDEIQEEIRRRDRSLWGRIVNGVEKFLDNIFS